MKILVTGANGFIGSNLYKEAEPITTRVKQIDFSEARRDLHHDPKIPLEGGVPKTIEWMKKIYGL